MESPVVLDKPPEYHGKDDRGFPFDEEESGAWSDLAARHPDIAARLRQHPAANWARKRRPASQDAADEFGDSFGTFDRFPFDDIPPEFREHFPSHFNRRFGQREERPRQQTPQSPQPQTSQSPQQQTTATQTDHDEPEPSQPQQTIPQYGLRNTVDLGQKSAADPSLVDADDRNQRSMSAPPESRNQTNMSAQSQEPEQPAQPQKVRNIPIFVEGRDKPVINDNLDGASHFGDAARHHPQHHPQQPPLDSSYFNEEPAMYHPPSNITKAFGAPPFNKFRQNPQPYAEQRAYPQTFARAASPARSQSPRPTEEIKIPVHHVSQQKPQPTKPQQQQPKPQQQQPPKPQQQQAPPPQRPQSPPKQPSPPPGARPQPPDPITQILAIQTDVLNLMTEVEKFTGTKKDKRYIFLDEMLTRNLIKLDNIETEGKENIRNARKEAIKCIQKCIAVLEAKAESNANSGQAQGPDEDMNAGGQAEEKAQNGEVDMKEAKEEPVQAEPESEQKPEDQLSAENKESPQVADTRPENTEAKEEVDKKPKKVTKNEKKRDKSKDKSEGVEPMQVDEKGEKSEPQQMEVDGAASQ